MSVRNLAMSILALPVATALAVGVWAARPARADETGPADAAAAASRHAGHVVAVDPAARRLTVEEMSPGSRIHRIVVQVEPTTSLVEIVREPVEVVDRHPDAVDVLVTRRYVERPLELSTLRPGDFVVVVLGAGPPGKTPVAARRVELTARVGAPGGEA